MKERFSEALQGKKIPILTLDHKWYKLHDSEMKERVADREKKLNALLKRQGKLNSEMKEIKNLKKRLMNEIVAMADEASQGSDNAKAKEIEQHKKLLEECNERLESHQDELLDLPREIDRINLELMLETMEYCYARMQENNKEIEEISQWVSEVRKELKKRLVRKQEMEQKNHAVYSYMHDVFGADVVDLFDMTYHPDGKS